MVDQEHRISRIRSDSLLEKPLPEASLAYGDLVYLTTAIHGKEYILQSFDHHKTPILTPQAEHHLIAHSMFMLKEEIVASSKEELSYEEHRGLKIKPGKRVAFLHILSQKYLYINMDEGLPKVFGSRLGTMDVRNCCYFLMYLENSGAYIKEGITGEDRVTLQVDESRDYFSLGATNEETPVLYFGTEPAFWRIHPYNRASDMDASTMLFGFPFILHNNHTGKYLAAVPTNDSVIMAPNSDSLNLMWITEPIDELVGSGGKKTSGKMRLQHFLTGHYLTYGKTLTPNKNDPNTVIEFSSFPLRVDRYITIRVKGEYVKAFATPNRDNLKDSILSTMPGVQSKLQIEFQENINKPEMFEFEVICPGWENTSIMFIVQGVKNELRECKERFLQAYEHRHEGVNETTIGLSAFTHLMKCLHAWLKSAKKANKFSEFYQVFVDLKLHFDLAELTTYAFMLEAYGLPHRVEHIEFQEKIYKSSPETWHILEHPRVRELVTLAPMLWSRLLIPMFTNVTASGFVTLSVLQAFFPFYRQLLQDHVQVSEQELKCVHMILSSLKTPFAGAVGVLDLSHIPLTINNSLRKSITFCGVDYDTKSLSNISSTIELYINIASKLIYTEFLDLKNLMLGQVPTGTKTILDDVLLYEQMNNSELTTNELAVWGKLVKLNAILKYRNEMSQFSVQIAAEVMCTCSDIGHYKDDMFEFELQKWQFLHTLLDRKDVSTLSNGLFEYAAGCLYSINYMVNGFLLSPAKVLQVVKEVYCFLSGFTVDYNPQLTNEWTQSNLTNLRKLVYWEKIPDFSVKKSFIQALELLKTALLYFQILEINKTDISLSQVVFNDKEPKKRYILSALEDLLSQFVLQLRLKDSLCLTESMHLFIFLIGAIKEYDLLKSKLMILEKGSLEQVLSCLDTVTCLDLLQDVVTGRVSDEARVQEVKESITWLISLVTYHETESQQLSQIQKILTSLGLTHSLLLLFELIKDLRDSELTSLVMQLTVKMCIQMPANKAKVLDYLHVLDFSYELPEFIDLLDVFGFLGNMDLEQMQVLVTVMLRGYLDGRERNTQLLAVGRFIDVFHSIVPLFAISSVLIQAVTKWAKETEDQLAIIPLLHKICQADPHVRRSIEMMQDLTDLLQKLNMSDLLESAFQETEKFYPEFTIPLIREQVNVALPRRMETFRIFETVQQKELSLSQMRKIGHSFLITSLEKSSSTMLILHSLKPGSNFTDNPWFDTAGYLFVKIAESLKKSKNQQEISQTSIRKIMESSQLHEVLVSLLLTMKTPEHQIKILKCLRELMQVNSFHIKEKILQALLKNKRYFFIFNTFHQVCAHYLAEVHKELNSQFELMTEYFKFFTVGCDLCNVGFQNFIREQSKDSNTNIDILQMSLSIMVSVANVIEKEEKKGLAVNQQQMSMMDNLMSLITEAISGPNVLNQKVIGSQESLYKALNTIITTIQTRFDVRVTAFSLLSLLCALLEKDDQSDQLAVMSAMGESLNFEVMQKLMCQMKGRNDQLQAIGVRICIFLCDFKVKSAGLNLKFKLETEDSQVQETFKYFAEFIGSVEIEKEKTIYNVLFPIDPDSKYLTKFTKELLLSTIHKQSLRQEKLDDFLSGVKTCEVEIQVQKSSAKWVQEWSPYWLLFNRISFLLAILINGILLVSIRGTFHSDRFYLSEMMGHFLRLLGIGQCASYFFGIFLYWKSYYYTLYYPLVAKANSQDFPELANDLELNQYRSPFKGESMHEMSEQKKAMQSKNICLFLYNIAFLVVSVIAIFYPPLYAILLLGVFSQNERFDTIIRALLTNWELLGVTFLLMCIVIYEFAILAYLQFYQYYNFQTNLECDDLLNCFISTLNMGLRGGLAEALAEVKEADYWPRLLFDVTFQVIIMMIFLNVVFGIIIDAFGDLRDERTRIEQDINNNCLICGRDRSTIDLRGETWSKHVTQVHSFSNYLNFMIYIRNKNIEDCSGIEKHVKEQVDKNSVTFMPTNSMALKQTDSELEQAEEAEEAKKQEEMFARIREILAESKSKSQS